MNFSRRSDRDDPSGPDGCAERNAGGSGIESDEGCQWRCQLVWTRFLWPSNSERRDTATGDGHRSTPDLPFGTLVRVTNLNNGRSVVVRINDRGPHRRHRIIDLAHGAASKLKMMKAGEIPVKLEIIDASDSQKDFTSKQ